ncbi:hypothetical protein L1887_60018 [Cichorium endivia]|nr:hypothetical protein L1887_60018 [Cichorium endivia]
MVLSRVVVRSVVRAVAARVEHKERCRLAVLEGIVVLALLQRLRVDIANVLLPRRVGRRIRSDLLVVLVPPRPVVHHLVVVVDADHGHMLEESSEALGRKTGCGTACDTLPSRHRRSAARRRRSGRPAAARSGSKGGWRDRKRCACTAGRSRDAVALRDTTRLGADAHESEEPVPAPELSRMVGEVGLDARGRGKRKVVRVFEWIGLLLRLVDTVASSRSMRAEALGLHVRAEARVGPGGEVVAAADGVVGHKLLDHAHLVRVVDVLGLELRQAPLVRGGWPKIVDDGRGSPVVLGAQRDKRAVEPEALVARERAPVLDEQLDGLWLRSDAIGRGVYRETVERVGEIGGERSRGVWCAQELGRRVADMDLGGERKAVDEECKGEGVRQDDVKVDARRSRRGSKHKSLDELKGRCVVCLSVGGVVVRSCRGRGRWGGLRALGNIGIRSSGGVGLCRRSVLIGGLVLDGALPRACPGSWLGSPRPFQRAAGGCAPPPRAKPCGSRGRCGWHSHGRWT